MSSVFSSFLDFHAYLNGELFLFMEKSFRTYILSFVTLKIVRV